MALARRASICNTSSRISKLIFNVLFIVKQNLIINYLKTNNYEFDKKFINFAYDLNQKAVTRRGHMRGRQEVPQTEAGEVPFNI